MTGPFVGSPVSLCDVAGSAGVSLATASRVLSNSPHPVAEATRERVLAAAARLDFVPNLVARNLVARTTSTFGVIVHDMTDEYFAVIARGIEDVAYASGLATLICNTDRQPDKELAYIRKLRSMRVDAIVFTGSGLGSSLRADGSGQFLEVLDPQLRQFESAGGVVVRLAPAPGWAADVIWPTDEGYVAAVDHLHALGHRRIGFVAGPPLLPSSRDRLAAATEALRAAGLGLEASLVFEGDYTREGGIGAARAVLDLAPTLRPTALMTANDQLAIGLLAGLRARGVAVPGEMSVVGFDDVPTCAFVEPALTTIRVPLYDVGALGARMAIDRLTGHAREQVCLPLELVVRASTAPPPR
jgi:LacI family transcriptional regulator